MALALLLAVSSLYICAAEGAYKLTLKPEGGVRLAAGEKYEIKAIIEPINLIEHVIKWSSDNEYIATVNDKGVVLARASGTTYIRAALETGARASCKITVTGRAVTKLTIDNPDMELSIGESAQLTYTINQDADDKRVIWTSDDKRVAEVSEDGRVTAMGYGTAVITLIAVNGLSATVTVFVPSDVKNIMLDPDSAMIALGATITLDAYVFPGNARNRELIWETSNKRVVAVDQNGLVTGVSIGSATVRVSTQNGVSASAEITVAKLPMALALSESEIVLSRENRSYQLNPKIEPASARDCQLTWASSDPDVVNVRGGKLTAQGYGTATVSVEAQNGMRAECVVTVAEVAEAISLGESEYILYIAGAPVQAGYTLTPEYGYAGALEWSVEDEKIASVSESGVIIGRAEGETRLTLKAFGGLSAHATVKVYKDERYIELDAQELTIEARIKHTLSAKCSQADAHIIWSSADNNIAVVYDGVIYGRNAGETVITAMTSDSALRAECALTVIEGGAPDKQIALTFDNGPGAATSEILDTLDAYGARATFFLCGVSIEKYPDAAKLFSDTLHELGNHTYSNKSLNSMSLTDIATSIERTDALIIKATGRQATVLRAPDAQLPTKLLNSFIDTRRFVGWTCDTGDMLLDASPESVRARALEGAFDTAILMFRDASKHTGAALDDILTLLIMDGYEFVTISELMSRVKSAGNVFVTRR